MINRNRVRSYVTGMKSAADRFHWLTGQRTVYCFGDSHIQMFAYLHEQRLLRKTAFHCMGISGATAMGMVNPNSKTNALQLFEEQLGSISPGDHLLFMLGEVDCGFVIWYRAAKYRLSVDSQFELSLANYQSFILRLQARRAEARGYGKIILASAPLPTILNQQDWGEVANARREVKATLLERTELTRRYNQRLRSFCDQHQFDFLDFEQEIFNPVSGVVHDSFRHPNPRDHHLNSAALAPVLAEKLRDFGFR